MEQATLGESGIRVSRLALGMAFREQADESVMEATAARALDQGVTFFDTANDYGRISAHPFGGPSERALGRAIAGRREEVVITTKVGFVLRPQPEGPGGSRRHIMQEIHRSLVNLATDYVDIYLVHRRDPTTPLEETVGAMIDVVRQGKARAWGICNYDAEEGSTALQIARAAGGPAPVLMQNPYSLLNRTLEREMLPLCARERLGVMAYSPLALGLLTGFYRPGESPPAGSLMEEGKRDVYETMFSEPAHRILRIVERIAAEHSCPPGHVALNWVLANPTVTVAIVGCDAPDQVDANFDATSWVMSADERGELDAASDGAILEVR